MLCILGVAYFLFFKRLTLGKISLIEILDKIFKKKKSLK